MFLSKLLIMKKIIKNKIKVGIKIRKIFQLIKNKNKKENKKIKNQIIDFVSKNKNKKIKWRTTNVKIKKDQSNLLIDLKLLVQCLLKLKFVLMMLFHFVFYG